LNNAKVRFVLVGGYSVIFHGYNRVTGDLDLFVEPSKINYTALLNAFSEFGLPTDAIEIDEFLNNDKSDVFTFGRPPCAIDLMTKLANFSFEEIYDKATDEEIDNLPIKVINLDHLKESKIFANRFKDLDDLQHL
jgi:hypothetical protein